MTPLRRPIDTNPRRARTPATKFGRPAGPYDRFMEDEGVPIYRGVGVHKVQNLPMKPWKRLGGNGSYIPTLRHRSPVGHLYRRNTGWWSAQRRA